MWLHIDVFDRIYFVPGWIVCISFGVLFGWICGRLHGRRHDPRSR